MKNITTSLFIFGILFCFSTTAFAVPTGAEYLVDETNDPLILAFTGLTGSLGYDLFLETDGNPSGAPWDVYLLFSGTPTSQGTQVQRYGFNTSYTSWRTQTITNSALTGNIYVRFIIDDFSSPSNPVAYFKNFTPSATYVQGGTQVPEPGVLLSLGFILLGLVVAFRRKRFSTRN